MSKCIPKCGCCDGVRSCPERCHDSIENKMVKRGWDYRQRLLVWHGVDQLNEQIMAVVSARRARRAPPSLRTQTHIITSPCRLHSGLHECCSRLSLTTCMAGRRAPQVHRRHLGRARCVATGGARAHPARHPSSSPRHADASLHPPQRNAHRLPCVCVPALPCAAAAHRLPAGLCHRRLFPAVDR